MDGMILTNKNEKKIVKVVNDRLNLLMRVSKKQDVSSTYAPYYDIILDEKSKNQLTEVKMSSIVSDKVKGGTAMNVLKMAS